MVYASQGSMDVSSEPGDGYIEYTTNYTEKTGIDREREVGGNENVTITGVQTIKAEKIFLN